MGRYGKTTTGVGRGGYSPPNYRAEQYQHNYGEKGQEESKFGIELDQRDTCLMHLKILTCRK